jgi:hypothetical protein
MSDTPRTDALEDELNAGVPSREAEYGVYRRLFNLARQLEREAEEQLDKAHAALAAKQSEIDRLMLEYCPEEMSDTQKAEWARHQTPVAPGSLDGDEEQS